MLQKTIALFLFWFGTQLGFAQSRMGYLDLLRKERQGQIYYEHTFHPSSDSLSEFNVSFKIENDFLNFVRNKDDSYTSEIKGTLEVFDSKSDVVLRTAFWSGTKTVASFQLTSARNDYLEGHIKTELPQGNYYYQLKFQGANQKREISSSKTNFSIGKNNPVWFYFLEPSNETRSKLINYGGNAIYGKDFNLSISIKKKPTQAYTLVIHQLDVTDKDTVVVNESFRKVLDSNQFEEKKAWIFKDSFTSALELKTVTTNVYTTQLTVPNSRFPNALYRVSVLEDSTKLSSRTYQSFWYDMPLSLFNLDVSIAMLEFIMPKQQISKLFSGNESERLIKFTNFWKEKDPTPDTEFNELMYEYYKRIDVAFREYSTPRNPGFDTDMGKVFIVYGPPLKKERSFPSNGLVIETWTYPKRNFLFQASSGFGDFQLIK